MSSNLDGTSNLRHLIFHTKKSEIDTLCLDVNKDFEHAAILTSGIPGGYRLVSTYDLPDFPKGGGGILEYTLAISNLKFFEMGGGGISE